jgi:hypothetical protein
MTKFDEMDEKVTLSEQLEENVGPVNLITDSTGGSAKQK